MLTNTYLIKVSSTANEQEIDQALTDALQELSKNKRVSIFKIASIQKEGSLPPSKSNSKIEF